MDKDDGKSELEKVREWGARTIERIAVREERWRRATRRRDGEGSVYISKGDPVRALTFKAGPSDGMKEGKEEEEGKEGKAGKWILRSRHSENIERW